MGLIARNAALAHARDGLAERCPERLRSERSFQLLTMFNDTTAVDTERLRRNARATIF